RLTLCIALTSRPPRSPLFPYTTLFRSFDFAGAPLAVFGVFDDGVNFKGRVVTVVIDTPMLEGGCRAQISNDHGLKDLAEELRVIREAVTTDTQGGAGQAGVSEMELRRGAQS